MDFEIWWFLAFAFVMTIVSLIYRIVLAFLNRGASRALPSNLEQRLARIEYTVESTAVEVERISESQRFLTRALTERGAHDSVGRPAVPEHIITPH